MEWQLAEAKNRFSEVVNLALTHEPQRITRRKDRVILLSEKDYMHLVKPKPNFADFLIRGESLEDCDLSRDKTSMRDFTA